MPGLRPPKSLTIFGGLFLPRAAAAGAGEAGTAANGRRYPRFSPGRIAQRESARFTRGRSLVRSQVRPFAREVAARYFFSAVSPFGTTNDAEARNVGFDPLATS